MLVPTGTKGDRVATFGAFDAKLQSKVKRRQERECVFAARQARVTKEQQEMTATSSMVMMESENDEDRLRKHHPSLSM